MDALPTSLHAWYFLTTPANRMTETEWPRFWCVKWSGWLLLTLTGSGNNSQTIWICSDCEESSGQDDSSWAETGESMDLFFLVYISILAFMLPGADNSAQIGWICADCEDSSGHEDSIWAEIGESMDFFFAGYVKLFSLKKEKKKDWLQDCMFILSLHMLWNLKLFPTPPSLSVSHSLSLLIIKISRKWLRTACNLQIIWKGKNTLKIDEAKTKEYVF